MASSVEFDIVVAAELDDGIGAAGGLPWKLPTDLKHLKRLTSETALPGARNAVIMGRKTWDTIPDRFRPLPARLNVVVTRQIDLVFPDGVLRASSFEQALVAAREVAEVDRIFVLGGGDIYRQALEQPGCRRIYLTRVLARYPCDTRFPPIPSRFRREALLDEGSDGGVAFRIEEWHRIAG